MIEVTSVKLIKTESFFKNEGRVIAIASVVINGAICINNIRVVKKEDKTFICFPNKRNPIGEYKDVVYPINNQTREIIQDAILKEYNK